jgi:hypothetical protein
MEIKETLEFSLREAMKANDDVRRRSLRMALAAVRQVEIDRQVSLDVPGVLAILQKEIKTRRESIEEARRAGRADLVTATEAEIKVLEGFLPQPLSTDELTILVQTAITETGAASPADMGKVMKVLVPRVAGRNPGDQVSALVRRLLVK